MNYLEELERLRVAFVRLGCCAVATATTRVLVFQGRILHTVPISTDAVHDCTMLGRWLAEQRFANGLNGWGEA